ncbi:MAG: hypothetical protein ACOC40_01730 [Thermoplasmatota archaeon]
MILEDIEYEVKIETPLYSTEDPKNVKGCLANIFPDVYWKGTNDSIKGTTDDLQRFKTILENMLIRDTARSFLKRKSMNNTCRFTISKQASCNTKINFSETKQPLGGIQVEIGCEQMNELIEALTRIED